MEIIITSLIAFASTNVDDIFLLTLFYGDKRFRHREILAGQLLGIGTLIAISLAGSLLGLLVAPPYMGLLGLIPIFLGVKGIIALWRNNADADDEDLHTRKGKSRLLSVAGVTIANGGDNIGIYVPLFATFAWPDKVVMITMFFIMTFVWCFTARYFVKHPYVAKNVERYGHIVTPFVLVALGVYIFYENGTFGLLGGS